MRAGRRQPKLQSTTVLVTRTTVVLCDRVTIILVVVLAAAVTRGNAEVKVNGEEQQASQQARDYQHHESEVSAIDSLVHRWSPIIWLAPDEKFMPLGVEDFLQNVYAAGDDGRVPVPFPTTISGSGRWLGKLQHQLPQGRESKSFYLHTKRNLALLHNETSFIHGFNPQRHTIPVYVTIHHCHPPKPRQSRRTFYQPAKNFLNEILSYGTSTTSTQQILSNIDGSTREDLNDFGKYFKKDEIPARFHVTYWLFFPYNEGKEVCFLGNFPAPFIFNRCFGRRRLFGNHVGDFEHLTLSFSGKSYPDELFLSVHDTGVYYRYDRRKNLFRYTSQLSRKGLVQNPKFPPLVRLTGDRPVLFAARGSHGLWSTAGDHHYVRVPRLTDHTGYGVPWKTWKALQIYHVNENNNNNVTPTIASNDIFSAAGVVLPSWMYYEGRWGNPKTNCLLFRKLGICELSDGPQGILMRKMDFQC